MPADTSIPNAIATIIPARFIRAPPCLKAAHSRWQV
jgi:hypothetical protein